MSILKLSYYAILENNHLDKKLFKHEAIHSDGFPGEAFRTLDEWHTHENGEASCKILLEKYELKTVDEQIGLILQNKLCNLDAAPLRENPLEYPETLIDDNPSKHKYGLRDGYFLICGDLIE